MNGRKLVAANFAQEVVDSLDVGSVGGEEVCHLLVGIEKDLVAKAARLHDPGVGGHVAGEGAPPVELLAADEALDEGPASVGLDVKQQVGDGHVPVRAAGFADAALQVLQGKLVQPADALVGVPHQLAAKRHLADGASRVPLKLGSVGLAVLVRRVVDVHQY